VQPGVQTVMQPPSESQTGALIDTATPPTVSVIDTTALASRIVNDGFNWIALPEHATPLPGALPLTTSLGIGLFNSDPRFGGILICLSSGSNSGAVCIAAGG
jgi:hypothetical protein